MKLLFDFLPLALFFGMFKYAEAHQAWAAELANGHLAFAVLGGRVGEQEAPVLLATVVVILVTAAQVAWLKLRGRRIDKVLWVSLVLVVVLGGMTVYLHDEAFIKWKPSALYWVLGLALWLSPLLTGRNLLRLLLGEQIELPPKVWHRLNFSWIAFFAIMGFLNLWVAFHFSTSTWVNFKMFGSLGLTLLFTLAQGFVLARYLRDDAPAAPEGEETR